MMRQRMRMRFWRIKKISICFEMIVGIFFFCYT